MYLWGFFPFVYLLVWTLVEYEAETENSAHILVAPAVQL